MIWQSYTQGLYPCVKLNLTSTGKYPWFLIRGRLQSYPVLRQDKDIVDSVQVDAMRGSILVFVLVYSQFCAKQN